MKLNQRHLLLVFCFTVFGFASGQKISEDDLSFDFLKWHYMNYPGVENNQWTQLSKDGNTFYYVEFLFEEQMYAVTYDNDGNRLRERVKFKSKNIPTSASKFLSSKFNGEKFKVEEFEQLNLYKGAKEIDSFYSMEVRVKKDAYVLYFDERMDYIQTPSTQLLSSL